MNIFWFDLILILAIYALGVLMVFLKLVYLTKKYKIHKTMKNWFILVILDSLSWPYYILRYGIEGFYKEIN